MEQNNTKLYNVIFPIWMLILYPPAWIIALPANFLIDFTVIFLTLKHIGVKTPKDKTKSVIIKSWLCGFAADFMGGMLMLVSGSGAGNSEFYKMFGSAMYNPFKTIYAFGWTVMCIAITAIIIYLLNYHYCLSSLDIEKAAIKKVSLAMAIFTAPYLFLLPAYF